MNILFLFFIVTAYLLAAIMEFSAFGAPVVTTNANEIIRPMSQLGNSVLSSAKDSVNIAINLVGIMTLFLGLMKIAEEGGLLKIIAKVLQPLMVRLFPEVPPNHPAMGSMIMNLAANALGLGNAATPFGIKAMHELDKLNEDKGTATNAMILFLAINTSSVTLIPTSVIALRAQAGSADPAGILPTTLFATLCSTAVAILTAKLFARWSKARQARMALHSPHPKTMMTQQQAADESQESIEVIDGYPFWVSAFALLGLILAIPLCIFYNEVISVWLLPTLILSFVLFGALRRVRIYEAFTEGAKEGFHIAVRIIPYLVAMMVSIGMLRASGALDVAVKWIGQFTAPLGLPGEALPMALIRPLSGSGAFGILSATLSDPNIGPDSYTGYLVSTIMGCTETTFYVIAVYFGAIQIKRFRYAIPAALIADFMGIVASVIAVKWYFL